MWPKVSLSTYRRSWLGHTGILTGRIGFQSEWKVSPNWDCADDIDPVIPLWGYWLTSPIMITPQDGKIPPLPVQDATLEWLLPSNTARMIWPELAVKPKALGFVSDTLCRYTANCSLTNSRAIKFWCFTRSPFDVLNNTRNELQYLSKDLIYLTKFVFSFWSYFHDILKENK